MRMKRSGRTCAVPVSRDRMERVNAGKPKRNSADAPSNSRTRRSVQSLLLVSLLLAWTAGIVRAQSNEDEYRVKAAFLFHFAQLVDWPADTATGAADSLALCTLGEDPFQGALEATVAGKAVGTRVIQVLHLKQPEDMHTCQILFLGKAQKKRIPILLADLHNAPVLTVGESADFLGAGGMICFLLEGNKLRFAINLGAAESARLKIGSRLLILAQNVLGEAREK
jgi:YfiR/HmsC-like